MSKISYEEKTLYKDRKALQWGKEGLVRELTVVADKLMLAETKEDIENLLDALTVDIEVVLDHVEALEYSKAYFAKKEAVIV